MTDHLMRIEMPKDVKGISRRAFIKGVGAMLAWSALLTVDQAGIIKTATAAPLSNTPSELRRSTLARHLGETFRVRPGSARRVAIQLTEIQDLPITALMSKREVTRAYREACFLIVFRGPDDQPLAQGSYRVEHPRIGRFDLFMVPRAAQKQAQYYEAVFNRLLV